MTTITQQAPTGLDIRVRQVINAYADAVRVKYKRPIKPVPPVGKTFTNCLLFLKMAQAQRSKVEDLMQDALRLYGKDFCRQAFRRDWPPLNVVVSDKTRRRLGGEPRVLKVGKVGESKVVKMYLGVLQAMDRKHAIEMVRGGWPSGPASIRNSLMKELKRAEARN